MYFYEIYNEEEFYILYNNTEYTDDEFDELCSSIENKIENVWNKCELIEILTTHYGFKELEFTARYYTL